MVTRLIYRKRRALFAIVACGLMLHQQAHASIYLVGSDGACDYGAIQDAINGAADHPGPDSIHIANNLNYNQQALTIGTQDLIIEGGYANCGSAAPSGRTFIDGAGGTAESVLRISGSGVRDFKNLSFSRGDAFSNNGGGIRFSGSGDLILRGVHMFSNSARNGGGIYFNGSGALAILTIETDTLIFNNRAQNSGGGVYINGNARLLMLRDNTTVQGNTAVDGDGGGIAIQGPARADIASPGRFTLGAIANNKAKRGGGIAVVSTGDGEAKARFFAVDAARPVRISDNRASERGGAIWMQPYNALVGATNNAYTCTSDILIDGNRAPEGAAVYGEHQQQLQTIAGSAFEMNSSPDTPFVFCPTLFPETIESLGRVACVTGVNGCNSISNNVSQNIDGQQTNGVTIDITKSGFIDLYNSVLTGNVGGGIVHGGGNSVFTIRNNLIVSNSLSNEVVQITGNEPGGNVELVDNTIAGNAIGGATHVLRFDYDPFLSMYNNIIWQPGRWTLLFPGGGQNVPSNRIRYNMVSDVTTLPQGPYNVQADPKFNDTGVEDYGLRISSPALDFSPPTLGDDRGIDGRPRDQQVRPGGPRALTRDVGALERQPPDPYLINGSFDGSLRMWSNNFPDYTEWAAFDDGPGGGSGSANMLVPGTHTGTPGGIQLVSINGLTQCFAVPWEGTYKLRARGFTKPDNSYLFPDNAALNWKLRFNSPNCTGPVNVEGDLVLPSAVGWNSPIAPAVIPIALADWNYQTTLEINLVALQNFNDPALQNPLFARVDNVVLEYDGVGPLFKDGFENGDLR